MSKPESLVVWVLALASLWVLMFALKPWIGLAIWLGIILLGAAGLLLTLAAKGGPVVAQKRGG